MPINFFQIIVAAATVGLASILFSAVDFSLRSKSETTRGREFVLLAEHPEDPQRAIVLVKGAQIKDGELKVELELRNNSPEMLEGHVWGQAKLGGQTFVESRERLSYKAKIKTFKTLRFALPAGFASSFPDGPALEIMVSDDATGLATRYGAPIPKPST